MKPVLSILTLVACVCIGCHDKSVTTNGSNSENDPFGQLSSGSNEPFTDDWEDTGSSEQELFKTPQFNDGDLVPCPEDLAEFTLEIRAMSGKKCYYRRDQSFRRFEAGLFVPNNERGFNPEFLVCAMLGNGFASGSFQYTKFTANSATIKIDWKASQNDDEQNFSGQFDVDSNQSGSVDAGNGNTFDWTFKPLADQ